MSELLHPSMPLRRAPRPASMLPPGPVSEAEQARRWWYCAQRLMDVARERNLTRQPAHDER